MAHASVTPASDSTRSSTSGLNPAVTDGFVAAPVRLLSTAARLRERPAYYVRTDQGWQPSTWRDYASQVRCAARALLSMGVQKGDAVAILSFNRPEWSVAAFAAMSVGAIPVGIYWTASSKDIDYILNHCKAPVLVVEDMARFDKAAPCLATSPHLRHVVMMGKTLPPHQPKVMSWDDFMAQGHLGLEAALERCLASLSPEDIGSLIYTSGTTGPSKAVVLSHGNLSWTALALTRAFGASEHDRILSYLPFAHIAEQMGCLHNQACMGFTVYFARSMEELGDHLKEVRPTIFFGVPRVWEKMQTAIESKLHHASGVKALMARWAMGVGRQWHQQVLAGQQPGAWLAWQRTLADKLVYGKVKEALGFSQSRLLISGAAPIAPDNLLFFTGLDLVVRELYGQSEACGPTSLSTEGHTRIGSVGKPLPGSQVRVADDGEILVRGPQVFQGYAQQPEATKETLVDGWLYSGDLGHIDADGFIYITGRKKDLIITSGGKNISPANIEADLMDAGLIEHAVVCGDGRNYLTALLTLDAQVLAEFAQEHGLGSTELHNHPRVLDAIQHAIDHVNTHHARVAHIRKFTVLREPMTIEGGELTATMKVKRKVVIDRHQVLIDQLYRD
jgi:long-chain acyl-CoA synthetase